MTLRRFFVLLKGLPADSAWAYFLDNDQDRAAASSDHNLNNIEL